MVRRAARLLRGFALPLQFFQAVSRGHNAKHETAESDLFLPESGLIDLNRTQSGAGGVGLAGRGIWLYKAERRLSPPFRLAAYESAALTT
jgi:hypothetical protein